MPNAKTLLAVLAVGPGRLLRGRRRSSRSDVDRDALESRRRLHLESELIEGDRTSRDADDVALAVDRRRVESDAGDIVAQKPDGVADNQFAMVDGRVNGLPPVGLRQGVESIVGLRAVEDVTGLEHEILRTPRRGNGVALGGQFPDPERLGRLGVELPFVGRPRRLRKASQEAERAEAGTRTDGGGKALEFVSRHEARGVDPPHRPDRHRQPVKGDLNGEHRPVGLRVDLLDPQTLIRPADVPARENRDTRLRPL